MIKCANRVKLLWLLSEIAYHDIEMAMHDDAMRRIQ